MVTAILGAIVAVFTAIPIIIKLFQKSEISKQTSDDQSVDDEIQKMKDDGRP